jgi:hypothetical protein
MPYGDPHMFSAPSKESIHVALLAKALNGEELPNLIYTAEEALAMIATKIDSYG